MIGLLWACVEVEEGEPPLTLEAAPAPDEFVISGPGGPQSSFTSEQLLLPCAALTGGEEDVEHHNLVGIYDGVLWLPWAPESGKGGLTSYDFSDPCNPVKLGEAYSEWMRESHTLGIGEVDGRRYLAVDMHVSGTEGGIGFWDITDATAPVWVSALNLPGYAYPDAYFRVALSTFWQGDRLYVAAGLLGVFVVDVSDPAHPSILNQVQEVAFMAGRMQIVGNLAFGASAGVPRSLLWDLSDPDDWDLLASFDTVDPEGAFHPYYFSNWSGPYALFARKDGGGGPVVYDISVPETPVALGAAVAPDGDGGYVFRQEDLLFQGESNFGAIYDFSDPTTPTPISRLEMKGDFDTLTPIGNVAVASVDEKGDPGLATLVFPWATEPDAVGPTVGYFNPTDGAIFQASTSRIGLSFDEQIEAASVHPGSFRLWNATTGKRVSGRYYTQEALVNFVPDEALEGTYLVEVPAGGITDLSGNPTAETLRWRFSTTESVQGDFPP
ncbi:MAG TPA: Ig-like domain-containing protein [Myxococcota bacterium]|nr:Ig-like domain-containing protein [Myxococcota bacterium]